MNSNNHCHLKLVHLKIINIKSLYQHPNLIRYTSTMVLLNVLPINLIPHDNYDLFCIYFHLQPVRRDTLAKTVPGCVHQIANMAFVTTRTDRALPVLQDGRVIIAPPVMLSQDSVYFKNVLMVLQNVKRQENQPPYYNVCEHISEQFM